MKKLFDAQVVTLMFIFCRNPPCPKDLHRYHTVRMFLDEGIVYRHTNDRLYVTPDSSAVDYSCVVPLKLTDKLYAFDSFEDMEKAADKQTLSFRENAEPGPEDKYQYYDLRQLQMKIEELGGYIDVDANTIGTPMDPDNYIKAQALVLEFAEKYNINPPKGW